MHMREIVQRERIKPLSGTRPAAGRFVAYWMQASQRAECNHALEYAIDRANELRKPLIVFFGLTEKYPEANERHYRFMLEGLKEVREALDSRGIGMVIRHISPEKGILAFAKDASLVVVDRDYLRLPREWRRRAADRMRCPLVQVETNVIVPIEEVSGKEEYAAATIRPKILKRLERFLVPLPRRAPQLDSRGIDLPSFDVADTDKALLKLGVDRSAGGVTVIRGGTSEAKRRLRAFIKKKLDRYPDLRNDPGEDCLSGMSPYLHFGQISPLHIALEISKSGSRSAAPYLEELVVRRELSMNFVYYNDRYDSFDGLPNWAKKTLLEHAKDHREYVYNLEELERASTHDPCWNAAQDEMRLTGKMHGYMRMYWGKKIIEWSRTPQEAFETALRLNNKYELDGRDANGFTGVAWCFGKHDRPWRTRSVFGAVRYMNENGLRRKFDVDRYIEKIKTLRFAQGQQ
jgi:deoxyribodipyrimidine photo-lyase